MKKLGLIVTSCLVVIVIASSLWVNLSANRLASAEVREYKGEKLSSVNDFRENSINGPQNVDKRSYRLEDTGLVRRNLTYTYDEILSSYRTYEKVVTLHCVEGWDVTILWDGILIEDLLKEAVVDPNAKTVIFYAYDGYSTSLPLNYILQRQILMAYKMNGIVIPPERGFPFQLVAESKWGYKWIKWITKIELSDDPNYKGYWESRGYSNDANLDEPFTD
jgi:DMSO/TMAO reductase YedYZ molybdopterin-dependent catalytic subunit